MNTSDISTERLQALAKDACEDLGDAQIVRIDDSAENTQKNRRVLTVMWEGREITVPIGNNFVSESGDETIINYISTAIQFGF